MNIRARNYLQEARNAFDNGKHLYGIWLLENALEICKSEGERREVTRDETFHLSIEEIRQAVERSKFELRRIDRLLQLGGLDEDDWMLVISDLSAAEAIRRYARREAVDADFAFVDATSVAVRGATAGFTEPAFLRALRRARGNNPNPLSLPL